jgi:hypothetical protein
VQLLDLHQDEVLESPRQSRRVPAVQGEDVLADYQFGANAIQIPFPIYKYEGSKVLCSAEYAGSISLSFCGLSYSHDYSRTAIPLRKA